MMTLTLIYAASLIATFVAWYLCNIIPARIPRGILRATIISLLCSPGILVGHGIGVAPTLFALYVQPSIFTFGPMLIIWIIALGVIFGVPALRTARNEWPPSPADIFLRAYKVKFVFFGVVAVTIMQAFISVDQRREIWLAALMYGLFFTGALVNLALCYWANRSKQTSALLTPMLFAAPALLVASPILALMWYGGGAVGGLVGERRYRGACWISLGVCSLFFAISAYRVYAAAVAPAHVTIGGGVVGNAVMAMVFAVLGVAPWLILRRQQQAKARAAIELSN